MSLRVRSARSGNLLVEDGSGSRVAVVDSAGRLLYWSASSRYSRSDVRQVVQGWSPGRRRRKRL